MYGKITDGTKVNKMATSSDISAKYKKMLAIISRGVGHV